MSEVVLSVAFKYNPSQEVVKLLEDSRDMVNFFIEKSITSGITSYAKLRKTFYADWKEDGIYIPHIFATQPA